MSSETKHEKHEHNAEHTHDHDHGDEGHVHGENCNHDNDKSGKGEKKVRKALAKLGMNKLENVNRVTIRQKDNYILIVKDPEVYSSSQTENTFIIFGEITFEDTEKAAKAEIEKMRAEGDKLQTQNPQAKTDNVEVVDDNAEVSEEGLDPASIETVMSESNVNRQKAVRALKKAEGDVVNAILSLAS